MESPLDQKIEAILFYKTSPVKLQELVKLLQCNQVEMEEALASLSKRLVTGATRLVLTATDVTLVTAPELSPLIDQIRTDEQKRDIGKAGAETLAIILYRGPISRVEIDRIRGVNSGYILRNLAIRGLIERGSNQKRAEFQITPLLLQHLGVTHAQALPGFDSIMNQLEAYQNAQSESVADNMIQ